MLLARHRLSATGAKHALRPEIAATSSALATTINKIVTKLSKLSSLTALPDGRLPDERRTMPSDVDTLQRRVRELELLCAEVYGAVVEIGLPLPLLNRLWTVAAHGSTPHAFHIDMPPRPQTDSESRDGKAVEPLPIPDIRLTDRPSEEEGPGRSQQELNSLDTRCTVMVVDDDPMMLEVLVRILQRENYELLSATSGPDALQLAEGHSGTIDLLITDVAMPQMKGRELAQRMRARYDNIKVLYQTGFSDMLFENRVELEEGASFVEKPFTARGLVEAARFSLFGSLNPSGGLLADFLHARGRVSKTPNDSAPVEDL
jgi:CheY-like chemotaxis protein